MLTHRNQALVKLLRIGHVEVARQHQVFRRPATSAKERMAHTQRIAPRGPIPQMPHVILCTKVVLGFYRRNVVRKNVTVSLKLLVLLESIFKDPVQGIGFHASFAKHVRLARWHVELDSRHSSPVLAAITLFLHQKEKLVIAIKRSAVFLGEVFQWLFQPHLGHSAFVFDQLAHLKVLAKNP